MLDPLRTVGSRSGRERIFLLFVGVHPWSLVCEKEVGKHTVSRLGSGNGEKCTLKT